LVDPFGVLDQPVMGHPGNLRGRDSADSENGQAPDRYRLRTAVGNVVAASRTTGRRATDRSAARQSVHNPNSWDGSGSAGQAKD